MFQLAFQGTGLEIFSEDKERKATNIDLQVNLVTRYLGLGMVNEAMSILDQLMTSFPENYDIRLYRGIAFCMKKDYQSADEEFNRIDSALDRRKKGLTRPLSDNIESILFQKEIFVFSPKNTGLLNFGRGVTLIALKKDYKTAVKKLASAKKEGYDWTNASYLLAYSYLKMGDYKKADRELKELLNRKEMDIKDYFLKGYLSYQTGMEREATSFFEKALEIKPDFIESKKNLASIHYN